MKKYIPPLFKNPLLADADDAVADTAVRSCALALPEPLMPYEAAAKAIFIRANGESAYYKATGIAKGRDQTEWLELNKGFATQSFAWRSFSLPERTQQEKPQ